MRDLGRGLPPTLAPHTGVVMGAKRLLRMGWELRRTRLIPPDTGGR